MGAAGFLENHFFFPHIKPVARTLWGPIVGPWLRSSLLFAPSGIFPLARLAFGRWDQLRRVIAFIYADLIIFRSSTSTESITAGK